MNVSCRCVGNWHRNTSLLQHVKDHNLSCQVKDLCAKNTIQVVFSYIVSIRVCDAMHYLCQLADVHKCGRQYYYIYEYSLRWSKIYINIFIVPLALWRPSLDTTMSYSHLVAMTSLASLFAVTSHKISTNKKQLDKMQTCPCSKPWKSIFQSMYQCSKNKQGTQCQ